MNSVPGIFAVGDLEFIPVGNAEDNTFSYLGKPQLNKEKGPYVAHLLRTPTGGMLSFEAVWDADPSDLSRAKGELVSKYPDAQVRYADLAEVQAFLTITIAQDVVHKKEPKMASNIEPNRVVFNDPLTSEEWGAVEPVFTQAAEGVLSITYTGKLSLDQAISVELKGDLAQAVQQLAPKPEQKSGGFWGGRKKPPAPSAPPDLNQCKQTVVDAIRQGLLTMNTKAPASTPPELQSQAESDAQLLVAKMLLEKIQSLGENAVYLKSFAISRTTSTSLPGTYSVSSEPLDLGRWFSANDIRPMVS
jgi:hypothetical protein